MAFPVDEKYIKETEDELKVRFPTDFKMRMKKLNGGEIVTDEFEFDLHPFFDKSDNKRISRTSNHITRETRKAREWTGFPENCIAIGSDGFGNQIFLTHNGDGNLTDEIYFWNHETEELEKIADTIQELEE